MPDPITGIMAGTAVLGAGSSIIGADAAGDAADSQYAAAQLGVQEQRAAREELRRLLQPYVRAGGQSLEAQMDLLGLNGRRDQRGAVDALSTSPMFRQLANQGENAILQRASATGGLRGGNVQGALAQFRPALLNQFIEQQYGRLAGITSMGQSSAAGVGAGGMQAGTNIANLLAEAGAARAGGQLAQGQAFGGALNSIGQLGGLFAGGAFGGGSASPYAALMPDVQQNIAMNPGIF
jgi:hypothetical protein